MTTAEPTRTPRDYGLLARPPVFGLTRKLGPVGTLLVFGGMAVIALLSRVSMPAAGVVLVVDAAALGVLSIRDRHHRNGLTRASTRVGWWRARHRRAHIYRSGTFGHLPHGRRQLPGIAAPLAATEWSDAYDRRFAVLSDPTTHDHSISVTADPDGAALVDQEAIDTKVARFGLWLGGLGSIPNCVGAAWTVESAPDSGHRVRREVEGNVDHDAHPIAQAMLAEQVQTAPIGSSTVRAYGSLTFSGYGPKGRRSGEEIGRDLAARLPGLLGRLAGTGAGAVRPATAADLAEIVHTAYRPSTAVAFDAARAAGRPLVLPWTEAGPTATQTGWEGYRHDDGLSCTYEVSDMPHGSFREDLLADLLAPHPDCDRKRVTILYRPMRPELTTKAVDTAVSNAKRIARRRRATEADKKILAAATAVSAAVADGAGLVPFSILITVTVTDPERLVLARAAVESMCGAARLLVHPVYGSQDSAFVFGLNGALGRVPSHYLTVPAELRNAL